MIITSALNIFTLSRPSIPLDSTLKVNELLSCKPVRELFCCCKQAHLLELAQTLAYVALAGLELLESLVICTLCLAERILYLAEVIGKVHKLVIYSIGRVNDALHIALLSLACPQGIDNKQR